MCVAGLHDNGLLQINRLLAISEVHQLLRKAYGTFLDCDTPSFDALFVPRVIRNKYIAVGNSRPKLGEVAHLRVV